MRDEEPRRPTKDYRPPRLTEYGSVKELTAGGPEGGLDNAAGGRSKKFS